jgi:hypothetical protein
MPDFGMRAVIYGKIVDDKEEGVYIDNIFFGGIASNIEEEELIKRSCANNVRGGYAVTRALPIRDNNSLPNVFVEARRLFFQIERDMMENELIMERNQERAKRKR